MARPTKQGIDYFPLDCQFDDKIELYLLEKESIGLSVLITLWQLIYQNEGYYIANGKDLYLLIKKRINVSINDIESCINLLIQREIFNEKLYKKYKILTSKAIQKRYFDAAKKKKMVTYNVNYIINGIDVSENSINVSGNATNVKEEVKEKEDVNYTHALQKFVAENLPNVSRLKTQLTENECIKLLEKFDKKDINKILLEMENWKLLTSKNSSVYLTVNNWLTRRK